MGHGPDSLSIPGLFSSPASTRRNAASRTRFSNTTDVHISHKDHWIKGTNELLDGRVLPDPEPCERGRICSKG